MSQLPPCDQAQEFLLRVEGNQSRRGIQPRTKGQSRELSATTQASQVRGGVESSAREVPLRAGSPVSPPSAVHASSRVVREVRGCEEDVLDGLEEELLASRGDIVDHIRCLSRGPQCLPL